MSKIIIYQLMPRWFTNYKQSQKQGGTLIENGCGKLNQITEKALQSMLTLGVTHVWYTGVIEHATQTDYSTWGMPPNHPHVVKGLAGSPYAIRDYYDIDPDLAENVSEKMLEFENLVCRTHRCGLGVVIDFVPNHVARNYHSDNQPEGVVSLGAHDDTNEMFHPNNNFYYLPEQRFMPPFENSDYMEFPAKVTGNDCYSATPSQHDWYETVKLNYGVDFRNGHQTLSPLPDTWIKMRDILLFWAQKGVDGFRCDMAEMVPVAFWHWAIADVKRLYPKVFFIAEIYQPHLYQSFIDFGGFDFLYDKVGMYDILRHVVCRQSSANEITKAWQSTNTVLNHMLYFLENHDEQRIASDFFAHNPIKAFPALMVAAALTTGAFLLYAGQELGEKGMQTEGFSGCDGRTSIFDYTAVPAIQQWANEGRFDGAFLSNEQLAVKSFYQKLLRCIQSEPVFGKGKMYDLQFANQSNAHYQPHSQFTWIRYYQAEIVLIVVNFEANSVASAIVIPNEAFEFLGIEPHRICEWYDLLDHQYSIQGILSGNQPVCVDVPAYGGRMLKLNITAT